jgi:hypothetical protein
MGYAVGPGNQWFHGSDWKLSFYSPFLLPEGRDVLLVQTDISWEGEVSPWLIITFWDLLQYTLQVPPLHDCLLLGIGTMKSSQWLLPSDRSQ